MLEVVLTFCQVAVATACIEHREKIDLDPAHVLPSQCERQGELLAVKWLEEHPGYRLARWGCGRPSKSL